MFLLFQEQERASMFDDELDAIMAGDISRLVRSGNNYEVKFRLLHVVESKLEQKTNLVDATVGTAVAGFNSPRKAVSDLTQSNEFRKPVPSPNATHRSSPGSPGSVAPATIERQASVAKRNIIEEIPKFDVDLVDIEDNISIPVTDDEEAENTESPLVEEKQQVEEAAISEENGANADKISVNTEGRKHQPDAFEENTAKKKPAAESMIRQMRNSIHGAPEIENFLRRCREMSAQFNKGKAKVTVLGQTDVFDDNNSSASDDETHSSDENCSDSNEQTEQYIKAHFSVNNNPKSADTHYKRSKMRRKILADEKKAAVEEERRRKELRILMELNALGRNRRASTERAQLSSGSGRGKKQHRQSALYMYSTDTVKPPILFMENIKKSSTTDDEGNGISYNFGHKSPEVSEKDGLEGEDKDEDEERGDRKEPVERAAPGIAESAGIVSPSQKVAKIIAERKKKRLTRMKGQKGTKGTSLDKHPCQSLASVGAGPPIKALNRKINKNGQYSSSEGELTVNKSVIISESKAEPENMAESSSGSAAVAEKYEGNRPCMHRPPQLEVRVEAPYKDDGQSSSAFGGIPMVPTSPPSLFKYSFRVRQNYIDLTSIVEYI